MMEGVNSNMTYLIYYKNICKCYFVALPSITIKKNTLCRHKKTQLETYITTAQKLSFEGSES
jgi:hypothetical protein